MNKTIQPNVSDIFSLVSQLRQREYTFQEGVNPLKLHPQEFTLLTAFACFHSGVKFAHISHLIKRQFNYSDDNSVENCCDAAIDQERELKNNRSCIDTTTGYMHW